MSKGPELGRRVNMGEPRNLEAIPSQLEEEAFLKFAAPKSFSLFFSVVADMGSISFEKCNFLLLPVFFTIK